jgi:hypothetical protein
MAMVTATVMAMVMVMDANNEPAVETALSSTRFSRNPRSQGGTRYGLTDV